VSVEDIQWLVDARGVPWKIARQAYADAEKAAKKAAPKGLAALDHAARAPSVRDLALKLLDEPARQPSAVAALERVKKESRKPLPECRAALAEANFDADKALAILGGAAAPEAPKPVVSPAVAAARKRIERERAAREKEAEKKAAGPKVLTSIVGVDGPDAARAMVLVQRRRPMTESERADIPTDRAVDYDEVVVYATSDGWKRQGEGTMFRAHWMDDAGRLVAIDSKWAIRTYDSVQRESFTQFVASEQPSLIAGASGVGEVAYAPRSAVLRWRAVGSDWTEIGRPDTADLVLNVVVTRDALWIASRTIARRRHDASSASSESWSLAEVEHTSPAEHPWHFSSFAVSPAGDVLAARDRKLYAGDATRIREVFTANASITSIAFFAGTFWVCSDERELSRWTGETLEVAANIKARFVSGRATLLVQSRTEVLESTDGETFRTIATSKDLAKLLGSADVYWAPR
jgi:hypothetical protein